MICVPTVVWYGVELVAAGGVGWFLADVYFYIRRWRQR